MRQDKAQAFFGIAEAVSKLSKDPSTSVGCILLDPDTLSCKSLGYNGFPRGVNDTMEKRWERPEKYSFVSHAEANAVAQAALSGTSTKNAICVVTHFPCSDCSKLLIQSGVKRVVTKEPSDEMVERWGDSFNVSNVMFSETGIIIQYV
ncbi:unnamed protein product [Pylaiella littoralis]